MSAGLRFVLAAALVATLAGCTVSNTAATPTATATPTPTSTALIPTVQAGLSFDDGQDLDASTDTAPVFANGFADPDSGWTEGESTDPDSGFWTYTSADGLCTATLSQIVIGKNFTVTKKDDDTTSDAALVWYFRDSPDIADSVPDLVDDAALPLGVGWESGDPGAEFRGFTAQSDDGSVIAAYARAFTKPGIVLFFDLTCPTADAFNTNSQSALLDSAVLTF